jgi:TolB protein
MRRSIVLLTALLLTATGLAFQAASARTPGTNGRIVFVQDTKDCDDCIVKSVEPDGSGTIHLPGGGSPRYSPDGTRIAAATVTAAGRVGTIVMDANGSNVTAFPLPGTVNEGCGAWSPDGETLLCEVWDDVHPAHLPGLFSVDASDGSDRTRLTTNTLGGHDIWADFSPDGSRIVFLRESPSHGRHILALFVAGADGSDPHRITGWLNDSVCCQASWSPDGTRILFASQGRLRTIRPDGTSRRTIKFDTGAQFSFEAAPTWSPDGTHIAFVMWTSNIGEFDLFTVGADGSDLTQLTDTHREEGFPDWGTAP